MRAPNSGSAKRSKSSAVNPGNVTSAPPAAGRSRSRSGESSTRPRGGPASKAGKDGAGQDAERARGGGDVGGEVPRSCGRQQRAAQQGAEAAEVERAPPLFRRRERGMVAV